MNQPSTKTSKLATIAPKQSRGQKTLEKLLGCAQDILVESGFEALNSNAVVQAAGMTPPAFYRYFKNKHDLLRVLCERLMSTQNAVLKSNQSWMTLPENDPEESVYNDLVKSLNVTREFKGGHVLLKILRAIPELQPIRLASHERTTLLLVDQIYAGPDQDIRKELLIRTRMALEIGYAMIEMLFEIGFEDQDAILRRSSAAIARLYEDIQLDQA